MMVAPSSARRPMALAMALMAAFATARASGEEAPKAPAQPALAPPNAPSPTAAAAAPTPTPTPTPTASGTTAPPETPPEPNSESPVSNAVFAAIKGQQVVFTLRSGTTLAALVLAVAGDMLIIATVPKGEIVTLPKREVFDVRVILPAAPAFPRYSLEPLRFRAPEPPPKPIPPSTRHFGMHFGVVPSVLLDIDYGAFLGFANVSIVMPFFTAESTRAGFPFGGVGTSNLWAFAFGTGLTFRISPTSRWQYDFFVIGGGSNWSPSQNEASPYLAAGAGFGFHVTLDSGFAFGIKAPLLGYASGTTGGTATGLGTFFGFSVVSVPLLSVGYRF